MSINGRSGTQDSAVVFNGAQAVAELSKGLFSGRAYRAYKEFAAATVLRIVASAPFMLTSQKLHVDAGQAKATITLGGTPGGTFVALPSVFSKNGLVVAPTPTLVITQNGTVTGGAEREVLRVNAGGGAGAISDSAGVRLLPAGTYYISIGVTGSTSGVYSIEYEEID